VLAKPSISAEQPSPAVAKVLGDEEAAGLHSLSGHAGFSAAVLHVKRDLLEMLIDASRKGLSVAGYGAPGKGNTLLNHCGIRSDLLAYTVDRNPYKHGRYLPGTHIPIFPPDWIRETQPDLVLVLPWNLREEIVDQLAYIREWGGQFIIPIPQPTVI
jgi:C-methyltransferase C-terminal domain